MKIEDHGSRVGFEEHELPLRDDIDDDSPPPPYPELDWAHDFGIAGEVAKLAADGTEVDPCAVMFSFLAAVAALFGVYTFTYAGETRHYPRLFVCIVGSSSRSRKGSSAGLIRRIINTVNEMFEIKGELPSLSIIDGGLSSHEGLIDAVRDASDEEDKEGNLKDPGVDDKRLLIIEEEFASTLKVASRDGNALSPILRKAWDGGTLQSLTRRNNRLKATNPHINLITHITGFELRKALVENEVHNGLANRFLWVCARRTVKVADPKRADAGDVQKIASRLASAIRNAKKGDHLQRNDDAQQRWEDIYDAVSIDEVGRAAAFTARGEAQILRMALIFALLECRESIQQKDLESAYRLWQYCDGSIRHVFCSAEGIEGDPDAQKILDKLKKQGEMTQTQMHDLFNRKKTKEELNSLLSQLEAVNLIYQDIQTVEGATKPVRIWKCK